MKEKGSVINLICFFFRLAEGDYSQVMKALKKVIDKDANAVCVTKAVEAVNCLAEGLRGSFLKEGTVIFSSLLEKSKDKNKVFHLSLSPPSPSLFTQSPFFTP